MSKNVGFTNGFEDFLAKTLFFLMFLKIFHKKGKKKIKNRSKMDSFPLFFLCFLQKTSRAEDKKLVKMLVLLMVLNTF